MNDAGGGFIRVGELGEVRDRRRMVIGTPGGAVLIVTDGDDVVALDNRCPHMGFPLVPITIGTPEFDKSRDERKRVEVRFAHLKTHHRFERMRLRGLSGARDEFHLAAIVQNLKTLANRIWRPPPDAMYAATA